VGISEFISQTLTQITKAVSASQAEVRELGGFISPAAITFPGAGTPFGEVPVTQQQVFLVEFDIAVTATDTTGTNAAAKLQIVSFIKLDAGGNSAASHETVSRIKFRVPLALPMDTESRKFIAQKKQVDLAETRKLYDDMGRK
jgi:hypothetical protein